MNLNISTFPFSQAAQNTSSYSPPAPSEPEPMAPVSVNVQIPAEPAQPPPIQVNFTFFLYRLIYTDQPKTRNCCKAMVMVLACVLRRGRHPLSPSKMAYVQGWMKNKASAFRWRIIIANHGVSAVTCFLVWFVHDLRRGQAFRGVTRVLFGGGGGGVIFVFCPTNFFWNQLFLSSFQKKLVGQNTNIWIYTPPPPPINALVTPLQAFMYWLLSTRNLLLS